MGSAKDIRTITELKTRASQLLDEINLQKRPMIITQEGKPRAVMMDVDSYEELRNAIGLLKLVAQGQEALRAGRWTEQETMFDRLEARLKARHRNGRKKA
jgi:prevent-host-death family protein